MLLRRMIKHVEEQNWVAIGIDFVIVVSGVFLGIQLGNWNEGRADQRAYEQAVERYIIEAEINLDRLNMLDAQFAGTLQQVSRAIDILQACEDTPENLALVEEGLKRIIGTSGIAMQTSALTELTSSPRLLKQQSAEIRRRFNDTKFRSDVFLREAELIELLPLEAPLQDLPILTVGPLIDQKTRYQGVDYSRPQRPLKLKVPISEACQDERLIKAFFTWERWQGVIPTVIRILKTDLEANLEALETNVTAKP